MRVLLIEDDKVTSSFVLKALKEDGYVVDHVLDGEEGFRYIRRNRGSYSVMVLDIMLPKVDGLKICRVLRQEGDQTPILMLSGRDQTKDKVEGLNSGADDYLTKPFDVEELVARVNALRRRNPMVEEKVLTVGNVEFDPNSHEVRVNGKEISLTNLEFRLLRLLMENRGKAISRAEIIEKVWDIHGEDIFSNSVTVHIRQLRKKLKDKKENPLITTVRGVGYKFTKV